MYVTAYTVGYPSTAYYPDAFRGDPNFYCFAYPSPPGFPQHPGFTEGTGEYIYNVSFAETDTYNKIYNLITDTPPDGYVPDENARDYVITKFATVYSCNLDVKYGGVINSINGGTDTVEKEFRYKKKDEPGKQDTYINYYVMFNVKYGALNCKCDSITNIPGTNNENVYIELSITLGDGKNGGRRQSFEFDWLMKNGINSSKSCGFSYYESSSFRTQSSWEVYNGDGTKTLYRLVSVFQ